MPDNLTTWRMQVRAVSGDVLVGEAVNELISTQPLLLRPALPRFLRVGDSVTLRTLVRNATKEARDVEVALETEGVNVTDATPRTVRITPGASEEVTWDATVTLEGTARVRFTANANGGFSDAVEHTLPVFMDVTPETTATGGVVTNHEVTESIYIPSYTIQEEGKGSLEVSVQPSLVGSLGSQLSSFAPPIHEESADDIASRVIATLAARKVDPSATLPFGDVQLRSDIAALIALQDGDGGWRWCRLCSRSDPQVTGWVLQALGAWEEAGHPIDRAITSNASAYIHSHIQRFRDVAIPPTQASRRTCCIRSRQQAGTTSPFRRCAPSWSRTGPT